MSEAMFENAPAGQESCGTDDRIDFNHELEPRDARALTEAMSVIPEGGDIYTVVSESGSAYTVDAREGRCDCPDARHNLSDDEQCKHERRVRYATGERSVPTWVSFAAVDPQLGLHVDTSPVVATTDGGVTVSDENAVDGEDAPCKDCVTDSDGELVAPCFDCYCDGVEFPDDR